MSGARLVPLAALPSGAAILDAAGSILALNDAFARLAGRDAADLLGKPLAALTSSETRDGEFAAATFGAGAGRFRIRIRSFDLEGARRALVVVEEAPEAPGLEALVSAHRLALEIAARSRHGINNSLMAILAHLELLLSKPDTPEPIRRRAEVLRAESEKIKAYAAELDSLRGS
jgi:PAS domain-containing protein